MMLVDLSELTPTTSFSTAADIQTILWFRKAHPAVVLSSDHGLARLVEAYRSHGHKAAKINPLLPQKPVVDCVPEITGLSDVISGRLNTSGK